MRPTASSIHNAFLRVTPPPDSWPDALKAPIAKVVERTREVVRMLPAG